MTKNNMSAAGGLALILAGLVAAPSLAAESTSESFLSLALSGRAMLDYTNAHAQNADFDLVDLEVRRLYLGLSGKLGDQFSFAVTGSLGDDGNVGLVGATIDWKPKGSSFKFRVGQFKTPMSLDESTSSKYTSVFERAAFTDAVQINRRLGFGIFNSGDNYTFSAGIFGGNLEQAPFDSGTAIAARATWTPVKSKDRVFHLGGSFRTRNQSQSQKDIRYRQRPFSHISNRIISTGRLGGKDLVLGFESAFIYKNMWAAGEYSLTKADCSTCASNPVFDGYYLETGIFFGGRKRYSKGSFSRPKVFKPVNEGGDGALAFVVRYDGLDLNDATIAGGRLDTIILGVDWYPTDHTRLGINYFNANATLGDSGSGLGSKFNKLRRSGVVGEDVEGVTIRLQYDF
ncbi:MAG: hypothetical protein COA47_03105 [Robiginitomaculum sp.]|nr:MAG: hypothetical protein COA47_03105 [Robiginitomaculum sp.]